MQSVRFFLHDWAMQLRCGVPVLIALNGCLMVAQEERLRAAISALFECARDGGSIPACLRAFPDIFAESFAAAFDTDEGGVELAELLIEAAAANESGFVQAKNRAFGRDAIATGLLAAAARAQLPQEIFTLLLTSPDQVTRNIIEAGPSIDSVRANLREFLAA